MSWLICRLLSVRAVLPGGRRAGSAGTRRCSRVRSIIPASTRVGAERLDIGRRLGVNPRGRKQERLLARPVTSQRGSAVASPSNGGWTVRVARESRNERTSVPEPRVLFQGRCPAAVRPKWKTTAAAAYCYSPPCSTGALAMVVIADHPPASVARKKIRRARSNAHSERLARTTNTSRTAVTASSTAICTNATATNSARLANRPSDSPPSWAGES